MWLDVIKNNTTREERQVSYYATRLLKKMNNYQKALFFLELEKLGIKTSVNEYLD